MSRSITISDFKVKVSLDSARAVRGLSRLRRILGSMQADVNRRLRSERQIVHQVGRQLSATRRQVGVQRSLNSQMSRSAQFAQTMGEQFTMIATATAGIYGMGAAYASVAKEGMNYQSAVMSLNAAVASTDVGIALKGKSIESLRAGQAEQRNFIANMAKTYGGSVPSMTSDFSKFFVAGADKLGVKETQNLFKSFSELGVVYGLDEEKQKRAMVAFTQMASKNQVMAEELKTQLGDVLPGSVQIFTKALNRMGKFGEVTEAKMYKLMEAGAIAADEVFPFVAEEMSRMANADGALNKALESTPIKMNRLLASMSIAKIGVFNQFDNSLGGLFDSLMKFTENKSVQTVIGSLLDSLTQSLTSITEGLNRATAAFDAWWLSLNQQEQKDFIEGLSAALKILGGTLVIGLVGAIGAGIAALGTFLAPILAVVAAVYTLSDAFDIGLFDAISFLQAYMFEAGKSMENFFQTIDDWGTYTVGLFEAMTKAWQDFTNEYSIDLVKKAESVGQNIGSAAGSMVESVSDFLGIGSGVSNVMDSSVGNITVKVNAYGNVDNQGLAANIAGEVSHAATRAQTPSTRQ